MNKHDSNKTPRDRGMDAMISDSRVTRGLIVMDDALELTDLDRDAIRERFKRLKKDNHGITNAAACRGLDASAATFSQVLSGTYPSQGRGQKTIDRILRKLDQWMGILVARGAAPKLPGFVWTRVATDIRAVADMAVKLSTMAAVFGQAGIGKTLTLQALHGLLPGISLGHHQ